MTPTVSTTPALLANWVRGGESETLEFKRSTGERREAARTVCGMLNHRGGRVLIGVTPSGEMSGQMVSDHTVEELAQELREIDPPVFPAIERVDLETDKQVLVVTVSQGTNRPYSYHGQAWRRVGNTTVPLSRDEYNRVLLERLHGERRWENEPAEDWTIAELNQAEIIRTLEEAIRRGRADDPSTRDPADVLRGFGLTRDGRILRAAAVLFGRPEPLETRLPQCLLRIARFRGRDKTEFLDNRQFHGNAFELLVRAERFIRENLPVAGRIQPGVFERIDDPLYPPIALREALANAVCHRDYCIGGGSIAVAIYERSRPPERSTSGSRPKHSSSRTNRCRGTRSWRARFIVAASSRAGAGARSRSQKRPQGRGFRGRRLKRRRAAWSFVSRRAGMCPLSRCRTGSRTDSGACSAFCQSDQMEHGFVMSWPHSSKGKRLARSVGTSARLKSSGWRDAKERGPELDGFFRE